MPARTARTYKIEKQSLEAHVDICAERYDRLEIRMDNLSEKVESNSIGVLITFVRMPSVSFLPTKNKR